MPGLDVLLEKYGVWLPRFFKDMPIWPRGLEVSLDALGVKAALFFLSLSAYGTSVETAPKSGVSEPFPHSSFYSLLHLVGSA